MIHPPASPNETTSLFLFSFCAVGWDVWVSGGTVTTHCKEGKASAAHTSRRETLMGPFFSTYDGLIALLLLLHFIFLIYPYFRGTLGRRNGEEEEGAQLQRKEDTTGILECQKKKFAGFLRVFPTNKEKIEKYIKCLHEIADNIDKVHQGCTVAKITANSISILGELSTIASDLLASCSASWSLGMAIGANGAKLVGTATDVAANLTDNVHQLKKREEGEKLMEEAKANLEELDLDLDLILAPTELKICDNPQVISDITKSALALNKYVEALACVQADPTLKGLALKIAAKGEETEDLKKVKEALAGTSIAMTKEERQEKYLLSIEVLMRRINTLALDSLSMANRNEVPVASVMRKKAGELKQILEKLEKIYESLRKESMIEEQF